jgi:two-component system, OmpR family, sensor histidine kinase KdpD
MDEGSNDLRETLLVCIGPSPTSARVLRSGARMAASLGAPWIAASVETARTRVLSETDRETLATNLRLAEQLGAETITLSGDDVVDEILVYARSHGVHRIVIGKSGERRWLALVRGTIVDRLLRLSGDIDIYVVQGAGRPESSPPPVVHRRGLRAWAYLGALGTVVAAALVALVLQEAGLSEANKAVVFIPAVVAAAMWWGLGPGIFAAFLSVLSFDFFFVNPYFTVAVADIEYVFTLLVLAAVALLVGALAARLRLQVETARLRERRLEVLYRLSRALSGVSGVRPLVDAAERELSSIFESRVTVYLPGDGGRPEAVGGDAARAPGDEAAAVAWVLEHGRLAGTGTATFPDAPAFYLPMLTAQGTVGVLAMGSPAEEVLVSPENRQLLETAATHIGIAIERDLLADRNRKAALEAETERMRSSLLSSVSHDLRTPLAVIAGTTSTLLELGEGADAQTRQALLAEVYEESDRLTRLVENLLAMTRLDSGVIAVDKQWFPLEDVIGSALGRLRKESRGRAITKHLPPDLPLVPLDGVMIEQVIFNLMDNALKYSPEDTPIDISVTPEVDRVRIEVADRGPGLAADETRVVFDKLHRGSASAGRVRGAGLGLAIAQAIVRAHGGEIWAENRPPEGGAVFAFTLPVEPVPEDLGPLDGFGPDDESGAEEEA